MSAAPSPLTRDITLDYLRCLCTAIIVCVHLTGLNPDNLELQAGSAESILFSTIRIILSMGVPPFFMLSGAFMIKKDISSLSSFYCKSYGRLLPWSIFFFFVGSLFEILNDAYNGGYNVCDTDLAAFYHNWFTRGGTGILWFIPALMGLYLITPLLVWLRKCCTLSIFCCITLLVFIATEFILIPCLHADYASYSINWFKGIFFIGHYMAGYCIYSICRHEGLSFLNPTTLGLALTAGIIASACWLSSFYNAPYTDIPSLNAQEALPVILSGLLFALFCKLQLPPSKLIATISSISIVIYLSHNYLPLPIIRFGMKWTGIWDTLFRDSFIMAFICYALGVSFSVVCALILHKSALISKTIFKKHSTNSIIR